MVIVLSIKAFPNNNEWRSGEVNSTSSSLHILRCLHYKRKNSITNFNIKEMSKNNEITHQLWSVTNHLAIWTPPCPILPFPNNSYSIPRIPLLGLLGLGRDLISSCIGFLWEVGSHKLTCCGCQVCHTQPCTLTHRHLLEIFFVYHPF